jgi:1,4-alpha-glucan branching enzyme
MQRWIADLNRCYRAEGALYQKDYSSDGFSWVDFHDREESVISYLRHGAAGEDCVLVVCNFTPVVRHNYIVGVPRAGYWRELLNSDAAIYGGSGVGNLGGVEASPVAAQGHFHSLSLTLPPLGVVYLKLESGQGEAP